MIKIINLIIVLLFSVVTFAQTDSTKERPLTIVEQMPRFPGGEMEMFRFIQKNIIYPQSDKELGIHGITYLVFVVEKDGSITDVKILRGIPCGAACDLEAIRVLKAMPLWEPGKQNGHLVRVQYNLPFKFSLSRADGREEKPYDCGDAQQIGKKVTEHYNAGVKFSESNEFEKAITEFTETLKLYPTDIDALYNRGVMYMKMNKKEEACKDWNKIKGLGRSDANGLLNKYCN